MKCSHSLFPHHKIGLLCSLENAVVCSIGKKTSTPCYKRLNNCSRQADFQKSVTCDYIEQFYVTNSFVYNTALTVLVVNVSSQSEGAYRCMPELSKRGEFRPCQLNVSGIFILYFGNQDVNYCEGAAGEVGGARKGVMLVVVVIIVLLL